MKSPVFPMVTLFNFRKFVAVAGILAVSSIGTAFAAVLVDNNAGAFAESNTTSVTLSNFTVGNFDDRVLVATIAGEGWNVISSVTYGGVAMTEGILRSTRPAPLSVGGADTAAIYYMYSPDVGTDDIVVNLVAESGGVHVGAASFYGVNINTAPLFVSDVDLSGGTNPTITSVGFGPAGSGGASRGVMVDVFDTNDGDLTFSEGAGQTEIFSDTTSNQGNYTVGASYQIGDFTATGVTHTWTIQNNEEWAAAGAFFFESGFAQIPEPSSVVLLVMGAVLLRRSLSRRRA